jgi:hypothetical protein
VGTFVYHCHLLEHEDGGMMGTIRVDAPEQAKRQRSRGAAPAASAKIFQAKAARSVPPGRVVMCALPKLSPG